MVMMHLNWVIEQFQFHRSIRYLLVISVLTGSDVLNVCWLLEIIGVLLNVGGGGVGCLETVWLLGKLGGSDGGGIFPVKFGGNIGARNLVDDCCVSGGIVVGRGPGLNVGGGPASIVSSNSKNLEIKCKQICEKKN